MDGDELSVAVSIFEEHEGITTLEELLMKRLSDELPDAKLRQLLKKDVTAGQVNILVRVIEQRAQLRAEAIKGEKWPCVFKHMDAPAGTKEQIWTLAQSDDYDRLMPLVQKWSGHPALNWINTMPGETRGLTCLTLAARENKTRIIELLLQASADPNFACESGETPATLAARRGHSQVLEMLIKDNCDVNKADRYGFTPTILAAANNKTECLSMLIDAHADLNLVTHESASSALHFAAMNGRDKSLKQLLRARTAQVNLVDKEYKTPLAIAKDFAKISCAKLIESAGGEERKPPVSSF